MNFVFISLFIGLGLGYLILGLIFSRGIKNLKDYFLAGRKLGVWGLTSTLVGTQIGGGLVQGMRFEQNVRKRELRGELIGLKKEKKDSDGLINMKKI